MKGDTKFINLNTMVEDDIYPSSLVVAVKATVKITQIDLYIRPAKWSEFFIYSHNVFLKFSDTESINLKNGKIYEINEKVRCIKVEFKNESS